MKRIPNHARSAATLLQVVSRKCKWELNTVVTDPCVNLEIMGVVLVFLNIVHFAALQVYDWSDAMHSNSAATQRCGLDCCCDKMQQRQGARIYP